ncbi:MAG: hypothetical protein LIP12_08835 [Clostridiales bacterium]|nr:hypothetical protein [Clostridiales bacterium]
MAEKELRRMNRTELIEIIYALQQNGMTLQQENEELHRQLEEKIICIENAGSIAEAALSLNHIFEDAEAAAQQYLDSVRAACGQMQPQTEGTLASRAEEHNSLLIKESLASRVEELSVSVPQNDKFSALQQESIRQECDQLREEARQECDQLREEARQECDQLREKTRQECDRMQAQALRQARNKIDTVNQEIRLLLGKYPMLEEYLKKEYGEKF